MKTFWIVFAVVVLVLLVLITVVCAYILSYISRRTPFPLPKWLVSRFMGSMVGNDDMDDAYWQRAAQREKWLKSQNPEQLYLTNEDGMKLKANYFDAKAPSKGFVLACHGCRSSGIGEFCFIAEFLSKQGYDLLLVDHRACGESEGKYMGYGYYESKDTMLWIDYINNRFGKATPIFLYGVSMGSATVMMMSNKNLPGNVKGIVADCGYTSAWSEFEYHLRESFHMGAFPFLYIVSFISEVLAGYSFKKANPIECVKKSKVPILFFHGEKDAFVPCFMVHELYNACTAPKDLLVVPDAVHAKSYQTHPELYEPKIISFFDKQLASHSGNAVQ